MTSRLRGGSKDESNRGASLSASSSKSRSYQSVSPHRESRDAKSMFEGSRRKVSNKDSKGKHEEEEEEEKEEGEEGEEEQEEEEGLKYRLEKRRNDFESRVADGAGSPRFLPDDEDPDLLYRRSREHFGIWNIQDIVKSARKNCSKNERKSRFDIFESSNGETEDGKIGNGNSSSTVFRYGSPSNDDYERRKENCEEREERERRKSAIGNRLDSKSPSRRKNKHRNSLSPLSEAGVIRRRSESPYQLREIDSGINSPRYEDPDAEKAYHHHHNHDHEPRSSRNNKERGNNRELLEEIENFNYGGNKSLRNRLSLDRFVASGNRYSPSAEVHRDADNDKIRQLIDRFKSSQTRNENYEGEDEDEKLMRGNEDDGFGSMERKYRREKKSLEDDSSQRLVAKETQHLPKTNEIRRTSSSKAAKAKGGEENAVANRRKESTRNAGRHDRALSPPEENCARNSRDSERRESNKKLAARYLRENSKVSRSLNERENEEPEVEDSPTGRATNFHSETRRVGNLAPFIERESRQRRYSTEFGDFDSVADTRNADHRQTRIRIEPAVTVRIRNGREEERPAADNQAKFERPVLANGGDCSTRAKNRRNKDDDEEHRKIEHRRTTREKERCSIAEKTPPRKMWNYREGGAQITDIDEGQPCLKCGDVCSGFLQHAWRKNCNSCKCPREAHDVCHEEWVSVRSRLGLKGDEIPSGSSAACDPRKMGLAWAPPGLPPHKVEEYFSMLPEESVPRLGTTGERYRDRQLAMQLPKQDLAKAYCRHLATEHYTSADDFMAARNEIALDIGTVQEIAEFGTSCAGCNESLNYGSLAVSAGKLGELYHPACFQCVQCRELLIDLAYCVYNDAVYCERHYAERLKGRCAACDELIFSGEFTRAMNKDWHSGHFCCWQCDESLTGQRYVLRDEHPYCIKCYESVFANGCEECSKIIGIDSKDLSYKDKHWHEACFLCNKCRVSLVDKQFGSKVDKIYCGNCYDAQFASRCDGCGEIFRAGTKKMEYKTRQWHEKCFCCVVCKNPIGTKSFIPREQEIYCAGCYEDKFATRCVKCNKIITSGGVTYKNEPWHRECFTCSNCSTSLAGQRFTSRDEKPYCAECFGELFAKRCTACTKPITGIGGTRFISFEDRHWHNDCFICAGCKTSLVGHGFITDDEDIICPECAKQKLM